MRLILYFTNCVYLISSSHSVFSSCLGNVLYLFWVSSHPDPEPNPGPHTAFSARRSVVAISGNMWPVFGFSYHGPFEGFRPIAWQNVSPFVKHRFFSFGGSNMDRVGRVSESSGNMVKIERPPPCPISSYLTSVSRSRLILC